MNVNDLFHYICVFLTYLRSSFLYLVRHMKRIFYLMLILLFALYFRFYSLFHANLAAFQDAPIDYTGILINGLGASIILYCFTGCLCISKWNLKLIFCIPTLQLYLSSAAKRRLIFKFRTQSSFQEVVALIKSGHRIDFLDENKE